MPVTTPVAETVAMPVPTIAHPPPVIVVVKVAAVPVHILLAPVIVPEPGVAFTYTILVADWCS
jgi:hypothetical protein